MTEGRVAYICRHCGAAFDKFDEFRQHRELVLDAEGWDDDWICPRCGRHFSSPGQLYEHEVKAH